MRTVVHHVPSQRPGPSRPRPMTSPPSGPRLLPAPRRVRPADLLPPVPVLPSHTAGWRDLVVLDGTHLGAEHAPPLPAGWASAWTVTTRRGGTESTVAADALDWDTVEGADPMLIAHWHPNSSARAGLKYVSQTGRHHALQSRFERNLITALDFDGLQDLTSQPFVLEWHDGQTWRRHTPDFAALLAGRPALFNVRPLRRLNDQHRQNTAALAAVAGAAGWQVHTVVGYPPLALPIVEACAAGRHAPDRIGIEDEIRQALADGPLPFHEAAAATVCDPFARAMLRAMIWHRQVSVDLNRRLNDRTVVALVGSA